MVGLVLRYAPLYRDLREAQAEGRLGEIVSIEASEHIPPYHGAFFMRDWRRYEKCPAASCWRSAATTSISTTRSSARARSGWRASAGARPSCPRTTRAREGVNDLELFHRKPSGWKGSDKVFDSDGDIIDYQTAIVEYANGAGMNFHTNLNVPDQFRRFAIFGTRGQAEGDFIRNSST